jgi:hypothetical protein
MRWRRAKVTGHDYSHFICRSNSVGRHALRPARLRANNRESVLTPYAQKQVARMLPRDQRARVVQEIWQRAPSQPLPLRLKNLRRAEQLVMLWRGFDRRDADKTTSAGGPSPHRPQ